MMRHGQWKSWWVGVPPYSLWAMIICPPDFKDSTDG